VAATTIIHAYSQCEDGVYVDLREVTRITLKEALDGGGSVCPWKCRRPFVISDWEEDFVRLDSDKDGAFWCELSGDMLPGARSGG